MWSRRARGEAAEVHVASKPTCLPPNEGREEIKAHRLLEPFAVLKSAAAQFKADALRPNYAIWTGFVDEIALLRDGRFAHV